MYCSEVQAEVRTRAGVDTRFWGAFVKVVLLVAKATYTAQQNVNCDRLIDLKPTNGLSRWQRNNCDNYNTVVM